MTMARVRTVFTGVAGTPWYSNLFFANDGGGDVSDDAHAGVVALWDGLKGSMATPITWVVESDVTQIDESNGQITGITPVANITGAATGSAEMLPAALQALVRIQTETFVNGRRLRGRVFVPGLTDAANDDGRVLAATVAGLNTAFNTLKVTSTRALPWCVWHRPRNGNAGSLALVSNVSTWTEFAVLRSRRD